MSINPHVAGINLSLRVYRGKPGSQPRVVLSTRIPEDQNSSQDTKTRGKLSLHGNLQTCVASPSAKGPPKKSLSKAKNVAHVHTSTLEHVTTLSLDRTFLWHTGIPGCKCQLPICLAQEVSKRSIANNTFFLRRPNKWFSFWFAFTPADPGVTAGKHFAPAESYMFSAQKWARSVRGGLARSKPSKPATRTHLWNRWLLGISG